MGDRTLKPEWKVRADKGRRFTFDERWLVKEARNHCLGSTVKEALRRAYVDGYTDAVKGERPRHPVRTETQEATVETSIAPRNIIAIRAGGA
jgi:hypothetical protein